MLIETSRFGTLDIDEERVITFRDGLLGFSGLRRFALIQTAVEPVFFWLQSVDEPGLAFVVCDPLAFVPDYRVPIRSDDATALALRDLSDCQVFVIVNKVDEYLTINLLGPLVVGAQSKLARQFVLSERRFDTRHRIVPASAPQPVARTA